MNIIIHRTTKRELNIAFLYLLNELSHRYGSFVRLNSHKDTIDIFGIEIWFRCGNVNNLAGTRPDYYNTDSDKASEMLHFNAVKCRGVEIFDIYEIPDVVEKHIDFVASGLNDEDSTMLQNICSFNGIDHNMMLSAIRSTRIFKV